MADFMVLKLLSVDDYDGALLSWRGAVGGLPSLLVDLTTDYDERLAALKPYTLLDLDVHGCKRRFALLTVVPAPDAYESGMVVRTRRVEPEATSEMLDGDFFGKFQATGQLAADIQHLVEFLTLRGNLEDVARESAISVN